MMCFHLDLYDVVAVYNTSVRHSLTQQVGLLHVYDPTCMTQVGFLHVYDPTCMTQEGE